MEDTIVQFIDAVINKLRCYMGEEYEITKDSVIKNNGTKLESILILKKGEKVTPSIYIKEFYEEFCHGRSVDSIVEEILCCYENCKREKELLNNTLDISFEAVKNRIIYRLVNYEKNKELLEQIPHFKFLDLAIVFHCLIRKDTNEIGTIQVTNDWLNEWKIDKKELLKLASINTPRIFPARICTMEEVIEEIIKQDIQRVLDHYTMESMPVLEEEYKEKVIESVMNSLTGGLKKSDSPPIYVLTNTCGRNGAGTLIYEDVIRDFAETYQSDFYILPSSIHEVLLIPNDVKLEKEVLKAMVSDINGTQVPKEEVLSNQVYLYSRETNAFSI
ncbi:DUF5688 family protein [Velocimicrobium porci]|uniref:Uncharacterized protein n=1 Tax=Velocimicrobium porci TaxID=2606634 RepID=A0A6L5XWV7_9FIRM|nr:DUF5688 family protein [Velocimicrobium porci]MSS63094.1 hypothetical protein [Velocimicrobium porci]